MGAIFQINESDLPWSEYEQATGDDGRVQIRYKALTQNEPGVPPVQCIDYAPGYTDPVHSHKTSEFFVVIAGELWLDDAANGPGSVVFIPGDTEYAVRAGDEGARYFRIVVR